jgi:lipase
VLHVWEFGDPAPVPFRRRSLRSRGHRGPLWRRLPSSLRSSVQAAPAPVPFRRRSLRSRGHRSPLWRRLPSSLRSSVQAAPAPVPFRRRSLRSRGHRSPLWRRLPSSLRSSVQAAPAPVPLVALHGVKGHGGRWSRLAGTGRRVYGPDLRGHGRSTWAPPWTLEQHASDVVATMDALELPAADVVGHSFGGAVAVYLAGLAPHRVRRLVLIDPAVGINAEVAGEHADASLVPPSYADPDSARAALAAEWPGVTDPSLADEEVAGHLAAGADGRWRFRWRPAAVATVYSELARKPVGPPRGVPTLILRAPREKIVRRGFLAACEADSDVTLVDVDCGHMMLEERPDEIVRLVGEFLDRQA